MQKRSYSAGIRKTVTYERNYHLQQQPNTKTNRNQQHARPQSQPLKQAPSLQQAKTTRIALTTSTSQLHNQASTQISKLTSIPILPSASHIQTLNYSNHKITTIPKNFASLYCSLIKLNLSNNELSDFVAVCYLEHLQEVNLSQNLISHVPKEVKKLTNLQFLDLGFNKLWYLSQVVALRELVNVRVEELHSPIEIILEGNSVLKTNHKAVGKLLSTTTHHPTSSSPQIAAVIKKALKQDKENFNPNIHRYNHQKQLEKTVKQSHKISGDAHKRTKSSKTISKSFNQSLLDVSAIMGPIPPNIIEQKLYDSQAGCQMTAMKRKIAKEGPKQFTLSQSPLLSQHKELAEGQISQTVNALFTQSVQVPEFPQAQGQQSAILMFKKIDNFDKDFIEKFKQYLVQLKEVQKKLKLTQTLKQIPESLKKDFSGLNQLVISKIQKIREVLIPFENFYQSEMSKISKMTQLGLNEGKGSEEDVGVFQQKIMQMYLNSQQSADLKWYEVWLHQFGKFQTLFIEIQKSFVQFVPLVNKVYTLSKVYMPAREQMNKIEVLKVKQKRQGLDEYTEPVRAVYSSKKVSAKKQLNNLLFSDNKYQKTSLFGSSQKQSLLLSQQPAKSVKGQSIENCPNPKSQSHDCLQCPIKDQQILELNNFLSLSRQKVTQLIAKITQLQGQINSLTTNQNFYEEVKQNQIQIISNVQNIHPSTYQNVLLNQAQCIQKFITTHQQTFKGSAPFINSPYPWNQIAGNRYDTETRKEVAKESIRKETGGRKQKTQLNEFLLTEQSNLSHKKPLAQSCQRTYFKSNSTLPLPQSHPSKDSTATNKNHKSSKNLTKDQTNLHQTRFKTSSHGPTSETHEQSNELTKFDSKPLPSSRGQNNQKNEVFDEIVVREFDEQKQEFIVTEDDELQQQDGKKRPQQKNQLIGNQQIFYSKTHQSNRLQYNSRPHYPKQTQIIEKKLQTNPSLSPPPTSNDPRTLSRPHSLTFKQFYPHGYDYHLIPFKQNPQYQNYLKHHLRNNIKQILLKKHYLDHPKSTDRPKYHMSTQLLSHWLANQNHTNFQKTDRNPNNQRPQRSQNMKQNLSGKYIKRDRQTDGK